MKKEKINWYIVSKEYVEYLKRYDKKVQNIDYKNTSKPYIGIILEINDFKYYVPISSVKLKHYHMHENIDFVKILDGERILAAINLNNMIPVLKNDVTLLKFNELPKYFVFEDKSLEMKYISLLRRELIIINSRRNEIMKRAQILYNLKSNGINTKMANRCCEFSLLEEKCIEYTRIQSLLPELKYIKNKEDLYYIYDNLDNQDLFEETVKKIDNKEKSIKIQELNKESINRILLLK